MNTKFSVLGFAVWLLLAIASLSMAWANGLGYIWAGVWLKPIGVLIAATYLLFFFTFGWLLVGAKKNGMIVLLWCLSGIALTVCVLALVLPGWFPLKITVFDFVVIVALPLGAILYRQLLMHSKIL